MSMFDPFKKLKLASAFLGVAEDPRADATLELGEVFGRLDVRSLGLDTARLLEQDGVRALYDSRYLPQPEPLQRLLDNGEGTLGFEVARYMQAQKRQLVGPPAGFDFRDPAEYLALRVRMSHPIAHVLTEYDASPLGELAMQSFYVGQLGNLISGVMISSALLQITRDMPDKLGDALAILAEAYQRGQAARPLLGIAWEELWSAQVPQLRELANLSPRTSSIAQLNLEEVAPPRQPQRAAAPTRLAGFILNDRPQPAATPTPTPVSASNHNNSSSSASAAGKSNDDAPQPGPRRPISKLLASFMALAEEEHKAQSQPTDDESDAEPELVDPSPARAVKPPPPPPRPPVFAPPPPLVPPPPSAVRAAPTPAPAPTTAPPQPGFSVEESDPKVQPALSPDDPDFF